MTIFKQSSIKTFASSTTTASCTSPNAEDTDEQELLTIVCCSAVYFC